MTPPRILSLGLLGACALWPALGWAQESVAAQEKTVHGGTLVIACYLILWGMIFGFVALVMRRQQKIAAEVASLEARMDALFPDEITP